MNIKKVISITELVIQSVPTANKDEIRYTTYGLINNFPVQPTLTRWSQSNVIFELKLDPSFIIIKSVK